jgi:hypothetical protein
MCSEQRPGIFIINAIDEEHFEARRTEIQMRKSRAARKSQGPGGAERLK